MWSRCAWLTSTASSAHCAVSSMPLVSEPASIAMRSSTTNALVRWLRRLAAVAADDAKLHGVLAPRTFCGISRNSRNSSSRGTSVTTIVASARRPRASRCAAAAGAPAPRAPALDVDADLAREVRRRRRGRCTPVGRRPRRRPRRGASGRGARAPAGRGSGGSGSISSAESRRSRELLHQAERDLGVVRDHLLERRRVDDEALARPRARSRVAVRGLPFRIAISPRNSPRPSVASGRSSSPTRLRICTTPRLDDVHLLAALPLAKEHVAGPELAAEAGEERIGHAPPREV